MSYFWFEYHSYIFFTISQHWIHKGIQRVVNINEKSIPFPHFAQYRKIRDVIYCLYVRVLMTIKIFKIKELINRTICFPSVRLYLKMHLRRNQQGPLVFIVSTSIWSSVIVKKKCLCTIAITDIVCTVQHVMNCKNRMLNVWSF